MDRKTGTAATDFRAPDLQTPGTTRREATMTVFLVLLALVVFVAVEAIRIRLGQRRAETGMLQSVQAFTDIRLPQRRPVGF